jgi:hypothetical protein
MNIHIYLNTATRRQTSMAGICAQKVLVATIVTVATTISSRDKTVATRRTSQEYAETSHDSRNDSRLHPVDLRDRSQPRAQTSDSKVNPGNVRRLRCHPKLRLIGIVSHMRCRDKASLCRDRSKTL